MVNPLPMKKLIIAFLILFTVAGVLYEFRQRSAANSQPVVSTTSPQAKTTAPEEPSPAPLQQTLTEELPHLARLILDPKQSQELRRQTLYELTQKGAPALTALSTVATTAIPLNLSEYQQAFEAGLRVTAIESLDELTVLEPNLSAAVKETMLSVLKTQQHQSLTLLAQISLSGIESGNPGKVKRAIDTLIKEQK